MTKTIRIIYSFAALLLLLMLPTIGRGAPLRVVEVVATDSAHVGYTYTFSVNRADIKATDEDFQRFIAIVDSLNRCGALQYIDIQSSASPEGPAELNARLSRQRAEAMRQLMMENVDVADSLYQIESEEANWAGLAELLQVWMTPEERATFDIAAGDPSSLARYRNSKVWGRLREHVFPLLRYSRVSAVAVRPAPVVEAVDTVVEADTIGMVDSIAIDTIPLAADSIASEWRRNLYVKSNIPAWGMLWLNAGVEVDCAPHWSVQAWLYYSGFNYFKSTRKFRTFTLMPEVRYWPRRDNNGFFLGAHAGTVYYNVAFDGAKRYQDHRGKTPAIGGGLSMGYRFDVGSSHRWSFEASVGAGIYRLDYDTFENRHNGPLTGRHKRNYVGLDQASFAVTYRFDITGKKGGDR